MRGKGRGGVVDRRKEYKGRHTHKHYTTFQTCSPDKSGFLCLETGRGFQSFSFVCESPVILYICIISKCLHVGVHFHTICNQFNHYDRCIIIAQNLYTNFSQAIQKFSVFCWDYTILQISPLNVTKPHTN